MNNLKRNAWRLVPLSLAAMVSMSLTSCEDVEPVVVPASNNVVDLLVADGNFSTLTAAVKKAGLVEDLSAAGPFTIFAPTNAAFGDFLKDNNLTADALLANPGLSGILTYHVVPANIASGDVKAGPVTSLSGNKFYVSVDPTGGIWINGDAMITAVDKKASNGVIHTLDYVITAPSKNIVEIALDKTKASTPEFTQLVAALTRAGLVEAVNGGKADNLTVFAPTDAAFRQLYKDLGVAGVNEIPLDLLKNVLLYHVVPARAFSQDLRNGSSLPTLLEGKTLKVDLPGLMINKSKLVATMLNIHATNGVIHVIDKVIVPE